MPAPLATRFLTSLTCSLTLALGCGDGRSAPNADTTSPSGRVFEELTPRRTAAPALLVLILDDEDTSNARAMREAVSKSFQQFDLRNDCAYDVDSLDQDPLDLGVVLVPASHPELALHPGNTPELLLRSKDARPLVPAFRDIVSQAIVDRIKTSEEPPRYSDGVEGIESLFSGRRKPKDAAERKLIELYDDPENVLVSYYLGVVRPDASSAKLAYREENGQPPIDVSIWAEPTETMDCVPTDSASEIPAEYTPLFVPGGVTRLGRCSLRFIDTLVDCFGHCIPTPEYTSDGSPDCSVSVLIPEAESCDQPGLQSPSGDSAPVEKIDEHTYRRCEAVKLTGDSLERCLSATTCPDCDAGYCLSRDTDLRSECIDPANQVRVRFAGGVDIGEGFVRIACAR